MAHDDLLVRNAIQRMGVNASVEWTRQCIAYKSKQDATTITSSSTTTSTSAVSQDLAQFIFEMYLLADLRTLDSKPLLPSSIATPHNARLFTHFDGNNSTNGGPRLGRSSGGVILQILEIQDISISSLKMLEACEAVGVAGDEAGGFLVERTLPRGGMIALDVTDGVRKMRAIVMEHISGIAMEMKLGTKIRVRDVQVMHGVLQLHPGNTLLLGGEVASMNQWPRRQVIMNQMKKRLGLPLDVLKATDGNAATGQQQQITRSHSAIAVSNTFNGISNSATTQNSFGYANSVIASNIWRNPQTAVSVQDIVPSTITSYLDQPLSRALGTTADTADSWKPFIPTLRPVMSAAPTPAAAAATPVKSNLPQNNDDEDEYMRLMREGEPQWDFNQDMDMDYDSGLPDKEPDWAVMPQLSADERQQQQDMIRPHFKADSPPLVATKSPARKGHTPRRRSLNLRAPYSIQQQKEKPEKQEKQRGTWEVETSPFIDRKPLSKNAQSGSVDSDDAGSDIGRERDENDGSRGPDRARDRDFFNLAKKSSPASSNGSHGASNVDKKKKQMQEEDISRSSSPFKLDRGYDPDMTNMMKLKDQGSFSSPSPPRQPSSTPPFVASDPYVDPDHSPASPDVGSRHRGHSRKKRRIVSDEEDDELNQGVSTNRRRSRSFLPSPGVEAEEDLLKVKTEKEPDILRKFKEEAAKERLYRTRSGADGIIEWRLQDEHSGSVPSDAGQDDNNHLTKSSSSRNSNNNNNNLDDARSSDFGASLVRVKLEKLEEANQKRSKGASYLAAIALSSDEDDNNDSEIHHDDGQHRPLPNLDQDVLDLDNHRIKTEAMDGTDSFLRTILSGRSGSGSGLGIESTRDYTPEVRIETTAYIKQEETLLEFDMDDEDDFGGLTEVEHLVPEVGLDQIERAVREGREVKAKARVHKLGKFSLTTLAVSIPVTLLPAADWALATTVNTQDEIKVEAVLDQTVVELLLEYNIAEFRNLVRVNEPEAKRAVAKLRTNLSEVESVECKFKGIRNNIPVIRELMVLSKKRR